MSTRLRQILENLVRDGHLLSLIHAGAGIHQAGCGGCIGMGQAPATGRISLRTVPRNLPEHTLSVRQVEMLLEGALINWLTRRIIAGQFYY